MDDVTLTLTLTPGTKTVNPPATGTMTAVRVTLDVCMSRNSKAADPPIVGDKIGVGRFLQVQRANLCGRAMLIARQAEPAVFPGNLVLVPMDGERSGFRRLG